MSNNVTITAGTYSVSITPAAQISGTITELESPYSLSISYYNQTQVYTTRPTVTDSSLSEQPEFT